MSNDKKICSSHPKYYIFLKFDLLHSGSMLPFEIFDSIAAMAWSNGNACRQKLQQKLLLPTDSATWSFFCRWFQGTPNSAHTTSELFSHPNWSDRPEYLQYRSFSATTASWKNTSVFVLHRSIEVLPTIQHRQVDVPHNWSCAIPRAEHTSGCAVLRCTQQGSTQSVEFDRL